MASTIFKVISDFNKEITTVHFKDNSPFYEFIENKTNSVLVLSLMKVSAIQTFNDVNKCIKKEHFYKLVSLTHKKTASNRNEILTYILDELKGMHPDIKQQIKVVLGIYEGTVESFIKNLSKNLDNKNFFVLITALKRVLYLTLNIK